MICYCQDTILIQIQDTKPWISNKHLINLIWFLLWASQVVRVVKNLPANPGDIRDTGSIPGLGRFPGGGHGNPLQYFCLENPTDRGAWWVTVHSITKSRIWLKLLSISIQHTSLLRPWLQIQPHTELPEVRISTYGFQRYATQPITERTLKI